MKLTWLMTAVGFVATASASSSLDAAPELREFKERQATSVPANSEPTISNNPLGFATATRTASTYGFFTKPSVPTLLPPQPLAILNVTNTTSSSDDARRYPPLPNSPHHRGNWLPGYDINTDYTNKWPNTGRTVRQNWRIQNRTLSPDGTPQQMLVINGQYSGPLLEANWGDHTEVTVHNHLESNGIGIHWHGFRQFQSNTKDSVPGVTQYRTTWYHTHFSSQYGAGVLGPLIVHGSSSANWDIDLGTIMVSDWYPLTVFQEDWFTARFGPSTASNYLLNGKNVRLDGSAGQRAMWQFQPGKKHLMRFINNGVDNHFKIQLDGHTLMVIATDNVPIVPYLTKELSIYIGQRYDVVVMADQPVANYYLRALSTFACGRNLNDGTGTANGIVSYRGSSGGLPIANGTVATQNPQCVDEPLASLTPIVTVPVDSTGFAQQFATLPVEIRGAKLATGENNIDCSLPTIETVADNRTISTASNSLTFFPNDYNIISLPTPNKWTFWVIQNQFFVPHPMHLHGHDFALLGQGTGTFDPAVHLSQLNFQSPNRRDVATLVASGWSVIATKVDNPGSWLMHCHIAWHLGEGLSLQSLELLGQIPGLYGGKINGREFQDQCRVWDRYFGGPDDGYGKSDSGL